MGPNKQNLLPSGRKKATEILKSSTDKRTPATVPIVALWRNLLSDFNPTRDPTIAPSVPPTVNQRRQSYFYLFHSQDRSSSRMNSTFVT